MTKKSTNLMTFPPMDVVILVLMYFNMTNQTPINGSSQDRNVIMIRKKNIENI